ncbi:Ribosomal RNA processing protein 1 like [Pseudolycoriella hygida]|uniref:Ribosomal RNA processing protein 1 like n=1 Tax=Pseudolycoriella hygida TaxID=35572 RepID=A0A9Q0MS59_9DIPT|nr:Ribosomal RNA processing protein 1 like [Pseudolycoriella hygida]
MKTKSEIVPNGSASNFVAYELKLIKQLAGNDSRLSEKVLKKLGKWLQLRSNSSNPFTDRDYLHLWKGLFFCMWMSDKPLTQEKLAETLASLLHYFDMKDNSVRFYGTFLKIMDKEWFGIDQWRIDKFMMLVRRVTRQCFVILHNNKWDRKLIGQLNSYVEKIIANKSSSIGFLMHFIEIFLDEIAKVTAGKISKSTITLLIQPFAMCIGIQRDPKIVSHTIKHIFDALLYQSDLGRAYTEKFEAWKNMGFSSTSIDDLELVADEDEECDVEGESEAVSCGELDPRAGRVDVDVPEIPFDANDIINKLEEIRHAPYTNVRSRKMIRRIIERYSTFATGKFPLGVQHMKINETSIDMPHIDDKVQEMIDFEEELYQTGRDVKTLNKKKRKKTLSNTEVQSKKVKLSKPEDSKQKKRKLVDSWVETKLTPEEIATDVSSTCKTSSNGTLKQTKTKNVINSATGPFKVTDGWDAPLQEGEIEYFVPKSNKKREIIEANEKLSNIENGQSKQVLKPTVDKKPKKRSDKSTPSRNALCTPTNSEKKVKIMLQLNRSQNTSEYFRQLRSSPKIPYDSAKKPATGNRATKDIRSIKTINVPTYTEYLNNSF